MTIRSAPWDIGATGPANQDGLRTEPATDIDPETGRETPNPNGVHRKRRDCWPERYFRDGHIDAAQLAAALRLRMAAEGMRERDPLAALGEVRTLGDGDGLANHVDRRAWFREMWEAIPQASRPVVERVVVDDLPVQGISDGFKERQYSRLRTGLSAIGDW